MNKRNSIQITLAIGLMCLAFITRFIPHPPNFTAVGAVALFGGAFFSRKWLALMLPLLVMFVSDLLLNNVVYAAYSTGFTWFTEGALYIYLPILLSSVLAAYGIKNYRWTRILGVGIGSSLLFYLVSNFGVWQSGLLYSKDWAGMISCYVAALPYLANQLLATLVYGAILFGLGYSLENFKVRKLAQ